MRISAAAYRAGMAISTDIKALSSGLLKAYVKRPDVGDFAMAFDAMDTRGRTIRLLDDAHAGRPIVLIFIDRIDTEPARALLGRWSEAVPALRDSQAQIVVVTAQADARIIDDVNCHIIPKAIILADGSGAIFARYGLLRGEDLQGSDLARIFLITPNGQIADIMPDNDTTIARSVDQLDQIATQQARDSGWIPGHAPILVIPQALDPDDCRQLIEHFEGSDGFRVAKPGPEDSAAYKFAASDYNRQDRVDHVLRDPSLVKLLDSRINERIIPQIAKAFAFPVTRRETLHIARYAGPREGIAIGHRDNVHPSTQYRRFALSVSLNTDYEGGELVFREYAGRGYRGDVGTAFVFSSSLLHEVEETTAGTRYNLISHFFNDANVAAPR